MPNKSLSRSGLLTYQKYSSLLAGNEAYTPSGFYLLESTTLGSTTSSVIFDNLDTYSGFDHFQLRVVSRSSATGTNQNTRIFLNDDTSYIGGNYWTYFLETDGSTVGTGSGNYNAPFQTPGQGIVNAWNGAVVDILDPHSALKNTTMRSYSGWLGDSGGGAVQRGFFRNTMWNNTAAVTKMEITDGTGFVAGSVLSLYGVK